MNGTRIISWLRTRGWLLNLVLIFIGAYLVAGATNSVVARVVRKVPTSGADGSAGRSSRSSGKQGHEDYVAIAGRNLMGAEREVLHPVSEAPQAVEEPTLGDKFSEDDLKKCTLSGTLRATLVADQNPEWSMAVFYNASSREPEVFTVNDGQNEMASDATLIEIRSREIIVRRRDHFERCLAEGENPERRPEPARRPAKEESEDDGDEHIKKTGASSYDIDRGYLENDVLDNLSKIATGARIVPSFKNGKPNGFKLFSIKPKSLFKKIGLQNGDVIGKINGYEMNSPDKALEIYTKLKQASSVTVDLSRRGQPMTMSYSIQ